jgi:RNA polymerase sigma factor (sigma-70 family)
MTLLAEDSIPTRYSLLSRLEDRADQDSWRDFFNTYWRLIYSVAVNSGLTEAEAQDVVQETIICVARDIHKFKRDRTLGSFKGWLRSIIRWRIADQFRRRTRASWGDPAQSGTDPPRPDMANLPTPADEAGQSAESGNGNDQAADQGRTLSDFRFIRVQAMAGEECGPGRGRECGAGLPGQIPRFGAAQKGSAPAGGEME